MPPDILSKMCKHAPNLTHIDIESPVDTNAIIPHVQDFIRVVQSYTESDHKHVRVQLHYFGTPEDIITKIQDLVNQYGDHDLSFTWSVSDQGVTIYVYDSNSDGRSVKDAVYVLKIRCI